MKCPTVVQTEHSPPGAIVRLCQDGYVRLTFECLRAIRLIHLLSGLDDDLRMLRDGAQLEAISGFTEWVSQTTPMITVGWDWQLRGVDGQPCCVKVGDPRSNLMLVDAANRDLGATPTAVLTDRVLDYLAWQDKALAAVSQKYS